MTSTEDTLADTLSELNISSKSKDILNIVFIGHVDAGKSTICGQVLHQLQLISERILAKFQEESRAANRESWYLSWALDTTPEERAKGKTTEVGRASFETKSKKFYILDAPGHRMYAGEMISGAHQADVAVLVVSARVNEFEAGVKGGQTLEHLLLAKSSGSIKKVVVLVNKMDDSSVLWSEKRFDEIRKKLGTFMERILIKDVVFIPVSGFIGLNIKDRVSKEICKFGDCSFLEYLDNINIKRDPNEPFVFTVYEKIKNMGVTLFGGKIEAGSVSRNCEANILPLKYKTTVQAITDEEDVEVECAYPGDNVKIRLKDAQDEINEGAVFCALDRDDQKVATEFTCLLSVLDAKNIISVGYKSVLHIKMVQRNCKILEFRKQVTTDNQTKMVKKHFAKKGDRVLAKIQVETAVVLYSGADANKANKFALRDEGLTVAIGIVRKIIAEE